VKLLLVVQRYGLEVAGGAERCARDYAEGLVVRGHEVDVVTTCALNYSDWRNHYGAGRSVLNGVGVERLPVEHPRNNTVFGPMSARFGWTSPTRHHAASLQREWMRLQGPYAPAIVPWIRVHGGDYDAAVFFTYLYYTTWAGLPAARSVTPTILFPTAHDEAPAYLQLFDLMFRAPQALAYLTEEEGELVRRRFRIDPPSEVLGVGVELGAGASDEAVAEFRLLQGLDDDPYVVLVGRVDPGKGSLELFDYFATYKRRNPGPLRLVVVGDPVHPLPHHPDVVVTGFVSEHHKHAAIAGSIALVQPSYFESFSIVLCEAWVQGRPALVQGRCDVLAGQCRRSGGGVSYAGYAEFEAGLDLLLDDPGMCDRMGAAGRRYVESRYEWGSLLGRLETLLDRVIAA
jgi:glycosyltransferase involved in cell wall biosynthesis